MIEESTEDDCDDSRRVGSKCERREEVEMKSGSWKRDVEGDGMGLGEGDVDEAL